MAACFGILTVWYANVFTAPQTHGNINLSIITANAGKGGHVSHCKNSALLYY